MKRIAADEPTLLAQVTKVLAKGGLIVYPTETSYGLGGDATNPDSVEKILLYKGNRLNKALSVMVSNRKMAMNYIESNPSAENVFDNLLPGPVTVVAISKGKVAAKVESERHTLGIRWSSCKTSTDIVAEYQKPITATSANTSGLKQIFSYDEWLKYVPESRRQMIDLFIDAGKLPVSPPSTVIDTTLDTPEVLRQGELVLDSSATHWDSYSTEETIEFGKKLIEQQSDSLMVKPLIVALQGELGAGKTNFVKGIAEYLGIKEMVNSPTYTIMHEYSYTAAKSSGYLYHLDTWRLFQGEGIDDLELNDLIKPGTVVAIEWQQKAKEWILSLPKPLMIAWVDIQILSENQRRILIKYQLV